MHPPVPSRPARPSAHADPAPLLATVLGAARRRALRDGDRQVDTAHLLHALVESDPETRAAFEGEPRVARVLGYLVQRSIGYGLRWQRSGEGGGAPVPLPAVRAGEGTRRRTSRWSPAAAAALEEALRRAAARGEQQPRGLDLLAGLAADPASRAGEVLRHAGIDPPVLRARATALASGLAAGSGAGVLDGDPVGGGAGGRAVAAEPVGPVGPAEAVGPAGAAEAVGQVGAVETAGQVGAVDAER
ncbi:Clp protease N-terminal domain-containing protein [Streptomyces sp. NPDC085466]|uniref:Clp protease N-terminal domain-containing protein n=1 Tax=Streptomyces sp. NPDC085466 TaxID=3365725 RepID=UPI0037D47B14